ADAGTLVNDGAIVLDPSTLTVAGLTGIGSVTIEAGSMLEVQGTIAGGETLAFGGSGAYLHLDSPGGVAGSVTDFGFGETIDLKGIDPTSVSYADGMLRQCPKTTASGRCPRRDGIIPFRMECVALDIEGHHLRVADLDALRIVACIKLASHRQASPGRGGRDQFDHCFPAGQGFSPPGLGDVAKQP